VTEPSTAVRAAAAGGRDARQFTRAASTTLGSSAGELAAESADGEADDLEAPARSRPRWLVPALGAGVVAVGALVLVLRGGASPTEVAPRAASVPAPGAAATAGPAAPAAASPSPAPPSTVKIDVSSQPAGAELWVGEEATPRGRTPFAVELERGKSRPAQLRLAGHAPVDVVLDPQEPRPLTVVLPATPPPPEHRAHRKKVDLGPGFRPIED
jgi:pyruvate/2-oxoglutarate dehydrogenase complex dihydrolipoamide acyltransferase (E2) component